jgi:hypothetical protein
MEEVRHNTALLERAVALVVQRASIPIRQAEALAAERLAQAAARRRLATGGAIALAAIGIGLGVYLGFWKPRVEPLVASHEQIALPVAPHEQIAPPVAPHEQIAQLNPHGPVINYEKFATQEAVYLGRSWTIETGHHYETDTDKEWAGAWCYTQQVVDGVKVKVDLVERDSPTSRPRAPIASQESLARVGLNDSSALDLATKCPWIDGKVYTQNEFFIPSGRTAPQLPTVAPPVPNYSPQPPTSIPPSYVAKDGFDLPGYDLPNMPLSVESQSECETSCNQTNACVAYVFNKAYRKCFLKSSVGTLYEYEVAYAGYKDSMGQSPRISSIQFHQKSGFIGTFYRTVENTRYFDCVTQCDKDQECGAFNFDSSNKQCTMLKSTFNSTPMPTVSSGVKGPLQ